MSDERPKRLSVDEILDLLSSMARDADAGADRFRALKMLASQEGATVTLPPPMLEGEVVDRIARVMKGAGATLTQLAYRRAFPDAPRAKLSGKRPTYHEITDDMRERARAITSLKLLNQEFPEAKMVRGIPKGYPSGRSLVVKAEWCQEQALKLFAEREGEARKIAHEQMLQKAENDATVRNGGTALQDL